MQPPAGTRHRYAALDGLRGIAALGVVLYHAGAGLHLPWLVPRGYLAVDFFFVLSGFVLARAYGERLADRRMSGLSFLKKRYARLWPVACAGTVLGIVLSWPSATRAPSVAIAGLFMLPNVWRADLVAYPFNPPHWSLWYELVGNYVYGVLARRLTTMLLGGWIVVSAAVLAAHVWLAGNADEVWLARGAYSLAVGVALSRVRAARVNIGAPLLSLLLAATLALGGPSRIDLVLILVVFPAIVWLGSATVVRERLATMCGWAGVASYPLYAWHMPILLRLIKP